MNRYTPHDTSISRTTSVGDQIRDLKLVHFKSVGQIGRAFKRNKKRSEDQLNSRESNRAEQSTNPLNDKAQVIKADQVDLHSEPRVPEVWADHPT